MAGPDPAAHTAASLAAAWCATARKLLGEIAPTVTDTLAGLASLLVALECAAKLAEVDPTGTAGRLPVPDSVADLGSRLRRGRNEILHVAEKIGQPDRRMRITYHARDHRDGSWTYLGTSGIARVDASPVTIAQRECLDLLDALEPWAARHRDRLAALGL